MKAVDGIEEARIYDTTQLELRKRAEVGTITVFLLTSSSNMTTMRSTLHTDTPILTESVKISLTKHAVTRRQTEFVRLNFASLSAEIA